MKRFLLGLFAGVALALVLPFAAYKAGAFDPTVSSGPVPLERALGEWMVDREVGKHAPKGAPVPLGSAMTIAAGRRPYAESCAPCHGAPGLQPAPYAAGLGPPPPDLAKVAGERPAGELFWIAKHGIRRSAMPAFAEAYSDATLWSIVAYVKHLPDLSLEERAALAAVAPHAQRMPIDMPVMGDDEAPLAADAQVDAAEEEAAPKKKAGKKAKRSKRSQR